MKCNLKMCNQISKTNMELNSKHNYEGIGLNMDFEFLDKHVYLHMAKNNLHRSKNVILNINQSHENYFTQINFDNTVKNEYLNMIKEQ